MINAQTLNHPIVVFIRGLPGSGKSHIAAALQASTTELLGKDKVITLDPDTIDYESDAYTEHVRTATANGVDAKLHVYRFLRAQAHEGIELNKIIIWNQPFTNLDIFNKMAANLRDRAAEHNTELSMLVVEVRIDPDIALARIAKRKEHGGHGPSEGTFQRFVADYRSFAKCGYNTLAIDGENDADQSTLAIMHNLQKLIQ